MTILKAALRLAMVMVALLAVCTGPAQARLLQDENLLAPLPTGFALGWSTPDHHWQEFVHPPETVDNWSRMVTIQILRKLKGMAPDLFATRLAQRWSIGCPGGTAGRVKDLTENGYPVAIWMYNCPNNPATHKPENMWMKATGGTDSLYIVQYAYRLAMDKALIPPAMAFLREVSVCDTRRADRPCPAAFR